MSSRVQCALCKRHGGSSVHVALARIAKWFYKSTGRSDSAAVLSRQRGQIWSRNMSLKKLLLKNKTLDCVEWLHWFSTMDSDTHYSSESWHHFKLHFCSLPTRHHLLTSPLSDSERGAQLLLFFSLCVCVCGAAALKRRLHIALQHAAIFLIINPNMPLIRAPDQAPVSFFQTVLLNESSWGLNSLMNADEHPASLQTLAAVLEKKKKEKKHRTSERSAKHKDLKYICIYIQSIYGGKNRWVVVEV